MNLAEFGEFWRFWRSAKTVRDKYLKQFEWVNYVLAGTLAMFAFMLFVSGEQLVSHKIVINGRFGWQRLRFAVQIFVICISVATILISLFAFAITANRKTPQILIMFFAIGVFFLGAIPLLTEGDALMELSHTTNSSILEMCKMEPQALRHATNKVAYEYMEMAHRLDIQSQYMVDNYMCTYVCPCKMYPPNTHPRQEFYQLLPEYFLNSHNRTKENKPGFTPMYWVPEDTDFGFHSFMECYQSYEKLAESDASVDLTAIFRFDENVLGKDARANFFKGPDRSDPYQRGKAPNEKLSKHPSGLYLYQHMQEMEVFQIFEDDFNCSGMCKQGLFYFDNPTSYGPPEDRCLLHFKQVLATHCRFFAVFSIQAGVICLVIFLLHCGLYMRPLRPFEQEVIDNRNVDLQRNPGSNFEPVADTSQADITQNQMELTEMDYTSGASNNINIRKQNELTNFNSNVDPSDVDIEVVDK